MVKHSNDMYRYVSAGEAEKSLYYKTRISIILLLGTFLHDDEVSKLTLQDSRVKTILFALLQENGK